MSIKIGIYAFFSYTIPGGIYSMLLLFLGMQYKFLPFELTMAKISIFQTILFVLISYILGLLFELLSEKIWVRFFNPKNIPEISLKRFKQKHPDIKLNLKSEDWPIYLAFIRHNNLNESSEIEMNNATCIMLRNISFSFLLFSILILINLIIIKFSLLNLSVSLILLFFSLLAVKQGQRFCSWFYLIIYETITVEYIKLSEILNLTPKSIE